MNREIKFRGLVADEPNTWVYGYLIANNMIAQVEEREDGKCCGIGTFIVIPETIGQFTNLCDKNGLEIYEGDIIEYTYVGEDEETAKHYPKKGVINFKNNGWHINSKWLDGYTMRMFKFEVMGNIYEVEDEESNFK